MLAWGLSKKPDSGLRQQAKTYLALQRIDVSVATANTFVSGCRHTGSRLLRLLAMNLLLVVDERMCLP